MPTKVFGKSSSSYDNGNKTDTSLFVKKFYLETNDIEANIEEDIDLKINTEKKIYETLHPYEMQLLKIMLMIILLILM